jgi:PKD repeat protein
LFSFCFVQFVFAESPKIVEFKLNGKTENVTFNPNSGQEVSIDVKAGKPVKFTRVYICSVTQACTGTKGAYTRYFTSSTVSETVSKIWNGKISSDTSSGFAPSGEYKIMVSMAEEGQDTVTEFGQYSIFLDFTAQSNSTSTVDSQVDENNLSEVTASQSSEGVSTHSITENLSNYNSSSDKLKVSAGRERLSYTSFPVNFTAISNKDGSSFEWSFGDGYKQSGRDVFHSYKTSGEYVLVLNASSGQEEAVSRTKVTILEPNIILEKDYNNGVKVRNNGKFEINIGGLIIQKSYESFIVAEDTIIPAGKEIALLDIFKNQNEDNVILKTYSNLVLATINKEETKIEDTDLSLSSTNSNDDLVIDEQKLAHFIVEFRKLSIVDPVYKSTQISQIASKKEDNSYKGQSLVTSEGLSSAEQTASVLEAVGGSDKESNVATSTGILNGDVIKEKSFWQKVLSTPVSLFKGIKNSFYETL